MRSTEVDEQGYDTTQLACGDYCMSWCNTMELGGKCLIPAARRLLFPWLTTPSRRLPL